MASVFYKSSYLYNFMLNWIHKSFLIKRYKFLSKIIGKKKKVLEIGCGTSLIKPFLHRSVDYEGWDLNKEFVKDSNNKGLNVKLKSAFDYKDYPKTDVILIVDFLHHITPNHEKFLRKVKKKAKMIIINEPFILNSSLRKKIKSWNNPIINSFIMSIDSVFGDNDGINEHKELFLWNYNKEELKAFFKKMGAKKIFTLGQDLIAFIQQ